MSSKGSEVILKRYTKYEENGMGNSCNNNIEVDNSIKMTQNENICSGKSEYYYDKTTDKTRSIPKEIIPKFFMNNMKKYPKFPIMRYKSDAKLDNFDKTYTYTDYYNEIMKFAKSVIKLGVEVQKSVCIMGFNSPQWFISELGAIFAGTIACGIYTTNNAEACQFIMQDCSCQLLILENKSYFDRLKPILTSFPNLRAVVLYNDTSVEEKNVGNNNNVPVYNWSEFIQLGGETITDNMVEERINKTKPDDCCILIYTSGTTGNPKGVVITHDNALYTAQIAVNHLQFDYFTHSIISYLPLSHIAANLMDLLASFICGFTVYFAQPDALKGTLINTLKEVRPTLFLGVPRVFEKMQDQMIEIGSKTTGLQRSFANWAKTVGYRNSLLKMSGKPTEVSYKLACVVFNKVKKALGLDRCVYVCSGAAPITQDTIKFFMNLDIQIGQIYGMSESSGPQTVIVIKRMRLGSTGECLIGAEMKLADCDNEGVGEICMRGRHIFKGYWNNEEKTKEALDSEGWLHSGDLGRVDDNGQLYITGRIKELIITSGGENIAPVPIEDRIKAELPFISNVMLVGDKLKFVSCLITLKTVMNQETQIPTNQLLPMASKQLGDMSGLDPSQLKTVEQVIEKTQEADNPISKIINEAIVRVNKFSVSNAARVQKWTIIPRDFSIPHGELGPTMKLKRAFVMKMYEKEIEKMY